MYGELDVFESHEDQFEPDDSVFWYLESTEAHEQAEFYESIAKQERE